MQTSTDRAARTARRLSLLAEIGSVDGRPGANRPGLGAGEQRALELAAEWMHQEGLAVSWDAVGNLYGRLEGSDPDAGEVWSGSHLDTVPNGGAFDGALGVLTALEAVAQLRSATPRSTLCVVAFRDEEGWRFDRGFFGSRAVCGQIDAGELESLDAAGVSVGDALAALGFAGPPVDVALPDGFVEVHIEQGPVLERSGLGHSVVSSIAGMAGYAVSIDGASGHAGTTPMAGRRDAFMAAAELSLAMREAAREIDGAVVTVGDARISDPATNVIPGHVSLSVDARAPTGAALAALIQALARAAEDTAGSTGCRIQLDQRWHSDPVAMSESISEALRRAADAAGVTVGEIASGAGHDAGILAAAGVSTGMLFVRSRNGGVSHCPEELSDESDIETAITVLTGTLAGLSGAW